jgi:hypothetical protein
MKPEKFTGMNTTFAKNQPPFLPLPAFLEQTGKVTSCWKTRWWERFVILFTGRIWSSQQTFGTPLQAQRLSALRPFKLPPKNISQ